MNRSDFYGYRHNLRDLRRRARVAEDRKWDSPGACSANGAAQAAVSLFIDTLRYTEPLPVVVAIVGWHAADRYGPCGWFQQRMATIRKRNTARKAAETALAHALQVAA